MYRGINFCQYVDSCHVPLSFVIIFSATNHIKLVLLKPAFRFPLGLKIPTRGIIPETPEAAALFTEEKNRRELRQVKFVPPETCKFTNEIDIYSDKVSMISLDSKNLYGIIIQSKSIADTQRNIYELLWGLL